MSVQHDLLLIQVQIQQGTGRTALYRLCSCTNNGENTERSKYSLSSNTILQPAGIYSDCLISFGSRLLLLSLKLHMYFGGSLC